MPQLAVILTCHNRRQTTVRCLTALLACRLPPDVVMQIFITDDGCTDGSAEAIAAVAPEAEIIKGDGTLFWGGGMRLAMLKAMEQHFDFYLWLNDDVLLRPTAIVDAFGIVVPAAVRIYIGSTSQSPQSTQVTYGGVCPISRWRPLSFVIVDPLTERSCQTMNGQFVLIPAAVVDRAGCIDEQFRHAFADFDYGMRAVSKGAELVLLPGFVGSCAKAVPLYCRLEDKSWKDYWTIITAPNVLPVSGRLEFCRRYAGWAWWLHFAWPYIKFFLLYPVLTRPSKKLK